MTEITDEEKARRRRRMAEVGERMDPPRANRQRRTADAIHASIAEAREGMPFDEALALLRSVGPIKVLSPRPIRHG